MNKIKYFLITILLLLILAGVAFAYVAYKNAPKQAHPVACTLEAKVCPDGTAVGREGPNCEFEACPAVKIQPAGIKGVAMLGPFCPVESIPPKPECADRPYKTDLVITSPDGSQILKQFSSDANGKFSVDLPPGEYLIESNPNGKLFSHCASQGTIVVEKEKYTNIILHCDTGIR